MIITIISATNAFFVCLLPLVSNNAMLYFYSCSIITFEIIFLKLLIVIIVGMMDIWFTEKHTRKIFKM
jgi:hypothetical protein